MKISITTLNKVQLFLNIDSSDSIFQIKGLIESNYGIPIESQTLVFAEMSLEDAKTAEDYYISENSSLHILTRFR